MNKSIPLKNITRHPFKSVLMIGISMIMSLATILGSIMTISMRNGLSTLESRLGADILVVPESASVRKNIESIITQGGTGYFYMDKSYIDQINDIDGIENISSQLYLTSANASCCSVSLQIIGFDPNSDFTITPWIKKSTTKELKHLDVIVGNDLDIFVGETIRFFNIDCNVISKLDKTGTNLDTSVYTNSETIKTLIQSSIDSGMNEFSNIDPEQIISCILIKTKTDSDNMAIANIIKNRLPDTKAYITKDMISDIAKNLSGTTNIISFLIIAIWLLGFIILFITFSINISERKKEFAIIQMAGASKIKMTKLIIIESLLLTISGSLLGLGIGLTCIIPFDQLIQTNIDIPFLLPDISTLLILSCMVIITEIFAGIISAIYSSHKINKFDIGIILRGEN